jgi:HD-GYP domain-containing protein (c-di-GMP phosphodiesterase class II)
MRYHLSAGFCHLIDAYDAMTNIRPYRESMTHDDAINEIKRNKGSQFDPDITDKMVNILEDFIEKGKEQGVH